MSKAQKNRVEFIGGPFDGFRQHVWDAIDDLPERIAIPVNQRSAKVLGLDSVPSPSIRTVIYYLQLSTGVARYCFCKQSTLSDIPSALTTEMR